MCYSFKETGLAYSATWDYAATVGCDTGAYRLSGQRSDENDRRSIHFVKTLIIENFFFRGIIIEINKEKKRQSRQAMI